MRRLLAVGLTILLLVGALPALGTGQSDAPSPQQTITTSQEFDDVRFHITVNENASARWTFRYERTLENEREREQFEEFATQFNDSQTPLYRDFRTNADELTSRAENETGRAMVAENFTKNAYVTGLNNNRGVVEMSFRWTSFAYPDNNDGGRVYVIGDVFQGGLYLGENQTLVVEGENGMTFRDAQPTDRLNMTHDSLAESDTVSWSGPYQFNDQRPMVKFHVPDSPTTTTTDPGGNAPPGDGDQESNDTPMMLFVAAIVVLLGLAGALAWRQGSLGSFATDRSSPDGGEGSVSQTRSTPPPSVSDEELLTDEARVKKLLRDNGGRMKQVNIVEETGWSKSKVSMLLSEMEDDGEISKLRVGRENIISLDGHEPDAAGSPLDG